MTHLIFVGIALVVTSYIAVGNVREKDYPQLAGCAFLFACFIADLAQSV